MKIREVLNLISTASFKNARSNSFLLLTEGSKDKKEVCSNSGLQEILTELMNKALN